MRGIQIDAAARRARVEAGVLSKALAVAAGEHGLAYLAGTSPDVGVLGYALGGGLSWMVRKHGLACNSIVAAEVVTADGRLIRCDGDTEPELFWAIRGGSGNLGAVTAHRAASYSRWPRSSPAPCSGRSNERRRSSRRGVAGSPRSRTNANRSVACSSCPDAPFLPEHLRGRAFVLVEAAFIGTSEAGAALVQPLRDLDPEIDTMAMMPASELSTVNMDPDFPLPYTGDGMLLTDLPPEAIDSLVATFVGSPVLHVEVRHLGGAAAIRSADHGVLDAIDQPFVAFTFGLAPDAEAYAAVEHHVGLILGALSPWDSGRRYLNFTESRVDPRSIFPTHSFDRLKRAKATYDPTNLFAANHPILG